MMGFETVEPGDIVFKGGNGLSVIVGKKSISLAGTDHSVWEIRSLHNLQISTSIPVKRISTSGIRPAASKEEILDAFQAFFIRPFNAQSYFLQDNTPIEKKLQSLTPKDLVFLLRALLQRDKVKNKDLRGMSVKIADATRQIVTLLADDLSMSSGLTLAAAKEHVFSLAFSGNEKNLWPIQAGEEKLAHIQSDVFAEAFGITPEEALDLTLNKPKIVLHKTEGEDGITRKSSQATLMEYLNQESRGKLSTEVRTFLRNHPESQQVYIDTMAMASEGAMYKKALEFSLLNLSQEDFQLISRKFLVREDKRLSSAQLAELAGREPDEIVLAIDAAVANFIQVSNSKEKAEFIRLVEKPMASQNVQLEKNKTYQNLKFLAPSTGVYRAAFDFAANNLDESDFSIIATSFLLKRTNRRSVEEISESKRLSTEEINDIISRSVYTLIEKAIAEEKLFYITTDMMTACPQAQKILEDAGVILNPNPPVEKQRVNFDKNPTYQRLKPLAPSRGKFEAAFNFAAENLDEENFEIVASAYLIKREHRVDLNELAKLKSMSKEQISQVISNSVLVLARKALEIGKTFYILPDMKDASPEAIEILGEVKSKKPKEKRVPNTKIVEREQTNGELADLITRENAFVATTGFSALLYKYAIRTLNREMFQVYVSSDLRVKTQQIKLEKIAMDMGSTLDEVKAIRNDAIRIIQASLELSEVKMPDSVIKALTPSEISTTVKEGKKSPDNSATIHAINEESIYEGMRTNGYNADNLLELGRIHESRGDFEKALCLYGAAVDVLEGQNQLLYGLLHHMEQTVGRKYSTETDFPFIEQYLQEKLNGFEISSDLGSEFQNAANGSGHAEIADEVIDAQYEELEPSVEPETTGKSRNVFGLSPRVVYALPPEIFVPGQRLRMVFNDAGCGSVEVTMELESIGSHLAGDRNRVNTNGHASSDGLSASFRENVDGHAEIHVSSSDASHYPQQENNVPSPK